LQFQQSPPRVGAALERADAAAAQARTLLADLAAATADEGAHKAVDAAVAALGEYAARVGQSAKLRNDMLDDRDNGFTQLQSDFTSTIKLVREDLPLEDLMPSEVEELQAHLRDYQGAIIDMRDAVNRFLATGDLTMQERVTAADASAEKNLPPMLNARISTDMKESVQDLGLAGKKMREVARRLFQRAAALDKYVADEVDPAGAALEARLGEAGRAFTQRAEAVRVAGLAAEAKARRDLLLLAGGIAAVLVVSGWVTARAVARPIQAMTRAVQDMADGRTDRAIGFVGRRDEVGRMAAALEVLRQAVARAFVQSQMIEQIPVGVMTAEPHGEFRITYLNAETRRVLATVQEHLPVPVEEMLGQSVDIFHREAAHVRTLLASPEHLPYRTRITLGPETLELSVSALRAPDGSYAGPMLAWHLLTHQVRLSETFERSVAGIATEVGGSAAAMERTAGMMSETAAASGERLVVVAGASRDATGNVQAVAASAEELARSVEEIARQVAESARIAGQAVGEAEATDQCVAGLSDAATKIGDVVRLIGDIAGRTNLLALNATIEAARAGEAGRGFAVVANEVKTLANQTARATGEIGAQITAMQAATGQVVGALRSIGGTIQRMNEIATAIAGAVEQQGAATQEIARAVQQAAAGTGAVDANIGEVTGAVQRTGTQAGEVVHAAHVLSQQSATLSREVAAFLEAMQRAA